MLRPEPTFRSELMGAANTLPWTLLEVVSTFPEPAGSHAVEGGWSIRDQILHLQNVELRYTIPNLRAIRAGGTWTGWGDTDREPDESQDLSSMTARLAEIYNDRVALLLTIPTQTWAKAVAGEGGRPISVEEIVTEECVQHDAEHLAQLLTTFEDWRVAAGQPPAPAPEGEPDARAVLVSASSSVAESLGNVLGTLPEECGGHRKDGEWSIQEQMRHVLFVYRRWLLPNLVAVRDGGVPRAWASLGTGSGVDPFEPDPGASLGELRLQLRGVFEERDALMLQLPAVLWERPVAYDRGDATSVRVLLILGALGHDCEHLSQLLGTARDWRLKNGLTGQ